MRNKPKALIVGAGAVGRGLIAPVLLDSGYRVTFVDVDSSLVKRINMVRWYPLAGRGKVRWIGPVQAVTSGGLYTIYSNYDLIFVSIKPENFSAPSLHNIFMGKALHSEPYIYVVENLTNAADKLSSYIGDGKRIRNAIANVIVPISPFQEDDITYTVYDPNMELVLERKDNDPELVSMARYEDTPMFNYEFDLKMYLHCTIHAVTAFYGIEHGFEYIHEVVADKNGYKWVRDAADVITLALQDKHTKERKHHISERAEFEIEAMRDDLMMDDVYRVARDPERKLAPDDRLIGALELVRWNLSLTKHPGYNVLLHTTRMAMNEVGVTSLSIQNLPSWNGIGHKYAGILGDLL